MTRLLRPFVSPDSYRALLYHLSTLVVGSVGLAVLIAGWTVTLVVAITPLVVPLLIGFRIAVGGLAAANGALARELVGSRVRPPVGTRATGFWGRGLAVLKDRAFWSQQAHLLASWTVSVVALTPFSLGTQVLAIPFYYRAVDGGVDFFWWSNVDTFAEALLVVPVGLALLVLGVFLLRPLTRVSRALADALLAGEADRVVRPPAQVRARRRRAIASHAAASITVGLLLVAIWALTTAGYFWPVWTLIPLGTLLAGHAWVVFVLEREGIRERRRPLAAHAGVAGVVWLMLVAVWSASGGDY